MQSPLKQEIISFKWLIHIQETDYDPCPERDPVPKMDALFFSRAVS